MLSCKDVSTKVSDSLDRKLTLWERLNVSMHLAMCQACRRFVLQMEQIRALSRYYRAAEETLNPKQDVLSAEAHQRIVKRLQHAKHQPDVHE